MINHVLIMAGGSGQRMNSTVPKQFMLLHNLPVIMHTISRFREFDENIQLVVVLPQSQIAVWNDLCKTYNFSLEHKVAIGSDTRFGSVCNGLEKVNNKGLVAIHDAVRPLVSLQTIARCFECAAKYGNAIPVVPLIDSIRRKTSAGSIAENRSNFMLVQTPQVFDVDAIKKAYAQPYSELFTDDASVAESDGMKIYFTEGNTENIKITHPVDIQIADLFMRNTKN